MGQMYWPMAYGWGFKSPRVPNTVIPWKREDQIYCPLKKKLLAQVVNYLSIIKLHITHLDFRSFKLIG